MDALSVRSHFRLAAIFEWLVATAFLLATIGVGSLILRELRARPIQHAATVEPARPIILSTPSIIPARAVSVPILPFLDGKEIRVGETVAAVATRLGRSAEVGRQQVDRGSLGERLTVFYEYAGSRFIVVYEPFERNGEQRIAAIYLP